MARSQSNTVWKVLGAGAAVIAGGAAFGYLFGSVRDTHSGVQPALPPVSSMLTTPSAAPPSSIHPRTTNGNYTAPGAPRIVIEEERQPILRRTAPAPTPDPEATQEATPTPVPESTPTHPAQTAAPDTQTAPSPAASNSSGGASNPGTPAPVVTPPPAAPTPTPADPDFEHVNSPPRSAPSTPDPEAGQQGGSPGKVQPGPAQSGDASGSGKVQFRVQTGAFSDESSARTASDALRSQGYAPSTRSERSGDHLVYKVQVGAYHSKTGANKAADDLQKKGYPAYISPINP